jgi:AGCS family alanine or glycine:cation symporter
MITIIADYIWKVLWIIILGASVIGFWACKQLKNEKNTMSEAEKNNNNQLFFISMAGSIGLGNVLVVIEGVNSYGPGVIVWLWVGALLGRYLKFWELYLSLQAKKNHDDFTGGTIYIKNIIQSLTSQKILSALFSMFLLIYCVESYQFASLVNFSANMLVDYIPSLSSSWMIYAVGIMTFIGLVYAKERSRFVNSSAFLMKIFLWGYFGFLIFLSIKYYCFIPSIAVDIYKSIFQSCWSAKLLAITAGIRTAIYSNDIGVGYEGIMQKYAQVEPKNYIAYCYKIITSNVIDVLVCTTSGLIALFYYKIYNLSHGSVESSTLVINIFKLMIPYGGHFALALLIFCAAFTTVSTYLQAGSLLLNHYNKSFHPYLFYILAFPVFMMALSYPLNTLYGLMSFCGGCLIFINCFSIIYHIYHQKKQGSLQ